MLYISTYASSLAASLSASALASASFAPPASRRAAANPLSLAARSNRAAASRGRG